MSRYNLSAKAAAAESRWKSERKDVTIFGTNGLPRGAQDGDNFTTNRITVADYNDSGSHGALGLAATWACVGLIAGTIASLPLTVYRKGPGGVPVEDPSHPLYWLLHTSPNYDQSAFDFWEFLAASIELQGNAYAEITKRDDGYITSLIPIFRPDGVNVKRLKNGDIEYRWTDANGAHVETQEKILHIRGFGGTPLGGVSPLTACRRSFTSSASADAAAAQMFANGVVSSGILTKEGNPLTPDQRKTLELLLQEKFIGAANAGRPMLLDGGLKWEQLSINPNDAQMLESRRFGIEEICRIFDVPPHLVGHTEGNTTLGSSIGEQTLGFVKFKLRKRLKRIEGALEKQLLTRADRAAGISIEFNVEGLLRGDSQGRAEFYHIMQQFMTKNEIRALEGLPPIEGGDVLMAQMQDVPLADAITGRARARART